jgi:hypothetical protein
MRRLAFALLLLCMAGASAAQPKPFSYRVYDMWGRPIVRIDMTPDSILVLQSDSVQVRLLPMVFEGMARDYIKYADSIRTGAQFEFGLDDDHFVFSFRQPWLLIPSFLALVLLLLGSIAVLLRYRRRLARLHADQARVAEQRRLVEQGRERSASSLPVTCTTARSRPSTRSASSWPAARRTSAPRTWPSSRSQTTSAAPPPPCVPRC